jgi:hypothetical protein
MDPVPALAVLLIASAPIAGAYIAKVNGDGKAPGERVLARARKMSVEQVLAFVAKNTDGRALGFMGEPGVNVFELNLDRDRPAPR